jgi:protein CMS1
MVGIEESGPVAGIHNQESVHSQHLPHSSIIAHSVNLSVLPTLRTRLAQRPKSNGAPTLIFIAGAALRVADVTRILKDKKLRGEKGGDIAKLFAKHIKLEEHITFLRRTKLSAAVGTPGRLGKLLGSGMLRSCSRHSERLPERLRAEALATSALTHIILDVSHQDAKKRSVLDIPETRDEVFRTVIGAPKVLQGIMQGKIQLVLL